MKSCQHTKVCGLCRGGAILPECCLSFFDLMCLTDYELEQYLIENKEVGDEDSEEEPM